MIRRVRSFFGFSSSERKVVGANVSFDLKDVGFIKNSNQRLTALQGLIQKYKDTAHEAKIRVVFDKTKKIHHYLVNKKRIHELELFHIQNTEHFLNTFNTIIEVLHHQKEGPEIPGRPEIFDIVNKKRIQKKFPERAPINDVPDKSASAPPPQAAFTETASTEIPHLVVPDISLNTFAKLLYQKKEADLTVTQREIGFFSGKEEKDAFLSEIAAQLGMPKDELSYVGNSMIQIPDSFGRSSAGYVPIIHWRGFMYALSLHDFRLFPVTMQRKNR